jgi:hypothetical protein
MPQPIRDVSVHSGPNVMLQRPDLAAQLGNICAHWNRIDHELLSLYGLVMGTYMEPQYNFAPPSHPVAYQVFDELHALGPRLDLLVRLLGLRAEKSEAEFFRDKLQKSIRKRFSERSLVVHGHWGLSDEHKDALILMPIFDVPQIYKLADFKEISKRLNDLLSELSAFSYPIYERLRQRSKVPL